MRCVVFGAQESRLAQVCCFYQLISQLRQNPKFAILSKQVHSKLNVMYVPCKIFLTSPAELYYSNTCIVHRKAVGISPSRCRSCLKRPPNPHYNSRSNQCKPVKICFAFFFFQKHRNSYPLNFVSSCNGSIFLLSPSLL